MATAIASTHIRMRRQSPNVAMSTTAPIVQKFDAVGDGAEHEGQREGQTRDQQRQIG